jgi:hypothetical protein
MWQTHLVNIRPATYSYWNPHDTLHDGIAPSCTGHCNLHNQRSADQSAYPNAKGFWQYAFQAKDVDSG